MGRPFTLAARGGVGEGVGGTAVPVASTASGAAGVPEMSAKAVPAGVGKGGVASGCSLRQAASHSRARITQTVLATIRLRSTIDMIVIISPTCPGAIGRAIMLTGHQS